MAHPQTIDLRLDRLNATILRLAVPSVLESMLTTMVYLADTILIGWLNDPVALAAVGLSSTLMWAADGLFQAISISAAAMVARFWGQEDFEGARQAAGQSLILSIIVAAVLMILLIPIAHWFLVIMGGEPDVVEQGAWYVSILLATSPISFTLTVATGIMRAAGDTRKPMYITGLMNVWNIIAAYILIFGLGPVPRLTLRGAALATSSARTVGAALALGILFSARTPVHLRLAHLKGWDGKIIRRIVSISLPNIGETIVSRLGFILFTRILSTLGTVALAAHQIALRIESIAYMPAWGLATAAAALVGQALGAQKQEVAEKGIRRTLLIGCGAMAALGVMMIAFGRPIVGLFGVRDAALSGMAVTAVRISSLELIGLASVMILSGCLRGAGDTRTPMIVTLAGTFLFRVPVTYLFALTLHGGLKGVWLATTVDWSMRALITSYLYLRGRWKTVEI